MIKYWGLLSIFLMILMGKLAGFLKDLLITFYHGVSAVTDAYFLSSSIASLLYMAVYASVPVLIVPMYSNYIKQNRPDQLRKDLSSAIFLLSAISLGISLFVFGTADILVRLFSGKLEPDVEEQAVSYLSVMAATFFLSTLVAFFNSIQTVRKVVMPSYSVPIVNNAIFCFGLYVFSGADEFISVLFLGVVAWLILILFNGWWSRGLFVVDWKMVFSFFKERKALLLLLPAILAFYVEQANSFIGIYFSSQIGGGSISIFSYSNKIIMIFISVFIVFLTATLFPRIAAVVSEGDRQEIKAYIAVCIRVVIIVSIPLVIYMSFYSTRIVELVFLRGNFTVSDAISVSAVFSILLLVLPFSLLRDIMNRVFFSYHDTVTPVILSLSSLVANFCLCYFLFLKFGLQGIAAAVVAATIFNCGLAFWMIQRRIGSKLWKPCFDVIFRCGCSGIASAVFLASLDSQFSEYWILLFIPFLCIYFTILWGFGVKEILYVQRKMFFMVSQK